MTRRLGRYELVHRLGAGGGGEVWEAVLHGPAGFRRRVALKLLQEGSATPEAREALLQEARLGALVAHPHVVSTLELGEHEGQWYFVMDLVRGCTASALRRRGPLPPGALLDIGVQVCDGLAHIHGLTDQDGWPLGLVHRDIKPGNLMIDTARQVRIVDLGIARLQGTEEVPAGTPGFVAPEQLRGLEGPRADIFALGATLAYLALGHPPFGKGAQAVARVLDPGADALVTDPSRAAELDDYLRGLGAVLARAMRIDPQARWASAQDFGEALRALYGACPDSVRLTGMTVPHDGESGEATGGLTTERGAFVGREAELEALERLLDGDARWVVVVGPGGVGKTRLVDEVCRTREVVRVDASRARTLAGLCYAVADALGVMVGPDPVPSVGAALAGVELLVVDEIEQAVDASVEAMHHWLAAVPSLRILASSRVAPGHPDATLVRVGPMSLSDSRRLFALRVGTEVPVSVLDPLLRALDRLPLAVELAAARARKTGAERVLAQLRATSSAQVPTLRESLEASWALLAPVDQDALVRLSAYEGAFDAQDAVAVLDPAQAPMARLERLVEHSILHVRGNRFRLLTSVRAFVRERLSPARRAGEVLHGRWMARLGLPGRLEEAYQSRASAQVMIDHLDDLMVASRRAAVRGDAEMAVAAGLAACQGLHRVGPVAAVLPLARDLMPLGTRLWELWRTSGRAHYALGNVEQADKALTEAHRLSEGLERRRIELNLAAIRFQLGWDGAVPMLQDALEELEAAGEGPGSIQGRVLLGQLHYLSDRLVAAEHHLSRALALSERSGRDAAHTRGLLASVTKRQGRLVEAAGMMREAVEDLEVRQERLLGAVWTVNLSSVLLQAGAFEESERRARRAVVLARVAGRKPSEGIALCVLSELAIERGDIDAAVELVRQAGAVAAQSDDAYLACEVDLSLGRVHILRGRRAEGIASLEAGWTRGSRVESETRAAIALWMARAGSADRALEMNDELEQRATDDEPYLLAQCALIRGEAELVRGLPQLARGALLQGSAELGRLDLPVHAPLLTAYERLRGRLAALR